MSHRQLVCIYYLVGYTCQCLPGNMSGLRCVSQFVSSQLRSQLDRHSGKGYSLVDLAQLD